MCVFSLDGRLTATFSALRTALNGREELLRSELNRSTAAKLASLSAHLAELSVSQAAVSTLAEDAQRVLQVAPNSTAQPGSGTLVRHTAGRPK